MKEVNKEFDAKMQKTIDVVMSDFASVRAGRANAAVLDKITVDYYGAPTPLNQVAAISSPDPRSLMIQPWDSTLLKAIEKAIQTSDLGINPQNDGKVIRLAFPQLTEERRKELTKQVKKYGENGRWPSATSAGMPWKSLSPWKRSRRLPRTTGRTMRRSSRT